MHGSEDLLHPHSWGCVQAFIDLLGDCLMRGGEVCPSPAHDRLCELISAQVGAFARLRTPSVD